MDDSELSAHHHLLTKPPHLKAFLLFHSQPSVPDLDLPRPVAGSCSRRQDGVLGHTQAGLAVSLEGVQRPSVVVVEEVSAAGGAT